MSQCLDACKKTKKKTADIDINILIVPWIQIAPVRVTFTWIASINSRSYQNTTYSYLVPGSPRRVRHPHHRYPPVLYDASRTETSRDKSSLPLMYLRTGGMMVLAVELSVAFFSFFFTVRIRHKFCLWSTVCRAKSQYEYQVVTMQLQSTYILSYRVTAITQVQITHCIHAASKASNPGCVKSGCSPTMACNRGKVKQVQQQVLARYSSKYYTRMTANSPDAEGRTNRKRILVQQFPLMLCCVYFVPLKK